VTVTIDRALRAITDLIVRSCDPDEVVLFGSFAKGIPRPDSDLDILVVGDFRTSRWLRARELDGLLSRFALSIDLHLLTPRELAIEATKPYTFLNTVQASCIRLYQKASQEEAPDR
jgi:uncharacterized protein